MKKFDLSAAINGAKVFDQFGKEWEFSHMDRSDVAVFKYTEIMEVGSYGNSKVVSYYPVSSEGKTFFGQLYTEESKSHGITDMIRDKYGIGMAGKVAERLFKFKDIN